MDKVAGNARGLPLDLCRGCGDDPGFYTFAVITDDPPLEVVEAGHDRCPVPIREDDIDAWLDPNPNELPGLYAILDRRVRPFYEHQLAKLET